MRRHLRVAAIVAGAFALILLSAVLGSVAGPADGVVRSVALVTGVVGIVVFVASGLWYTALFIREFLRSSA